MRHATVLAHVAILLLLLPATASAETLHYLENTVGVYDSLGRKVGNHEWSHSRIAGDPWFAWVAFVTGSGTTLGVRVSADGWSTNVVYFQSNDCSGSPWVLGEVAVAGPRDTAYAPTSTRRLSWMRSALWGRHPECLRFEDDPSVEMHEIPGRRGYYAPAAPAVDLRDYFEPPFSLRPRGAPVPP